MNIPYIDMIKIQAKVLIPLIKALEEKFGKEDVHKVVLSVIEKNAYQEGVESWAALTGSTGEKIAAAGEFFATTSDGSSAIDIEPVKFTDTDIVLNITRCQYAEFFKELGETEIGELLACCPDFSRTEGYNAGVTLERENTIMSGADKCDFHYIIKK